MGQQEVYDFLVANKEKWFTSKEIAEAIGQSKGSTTNNLSKMKHHGEVKIMSEKHGQLKYSYSPTKLRWSRWDL